MRRTIAILSLVVGCHYSTATDHPGDDANVDPSSEAGADAQACFGPTGFAVCAIPLPTQTVDLNAPIDTDSSGGSAVCADPTPTSWTQQGQDDACVVIAETITLGLGTTVTVTGNRPLVLFATNSLLIAGTLDLASHRIGDTRGPDSDAGECNNSSAGNTNNNKGGGGGGGSFGSPGEIGGKGDAGAANNGSPGAIENAPHAKLHGGCRGGTGAAGDDQTAPGGHGGGAAYLLAGGTLTINGVINASGAGAVGGDNARGGGGGGGSGGMIVLASPAVSVAGTLIANGGGGGGGADPSIGNLGSDPDPATPLVQALAGLKGGNASSAGGKGAAGPDSAAGGQQGSDGGGGGGGGLGVIRVVLGTVPASVTISPVATN